MLLRESLGISADGSEKAFSSADLEAMMKRIPERINYNPRNPAEQTNHIIVAVDPSGGGASAFSIATLTQDHRGFYHVRSRLLHSKPHLYSFIWVAPKRDPSPHFGDEHDQRERGIGPLAHGCEVVGHDERQRPVPQVCH